MAAMLHVYVGVGIAASLLIRGLWRRYREGVAETWPLVPGYVEQRTMRDVDGVPHIELAYSYQILGETHAGFLELPFLSEKAGDAFYDRFRPGEHIVVRVHPAHGARSVMRVQDQAVASGEDV